MPAQLELGYDRKPTKGLSESRQRFAEFFVATGNRKQSAILAGYSESSASETGRVLLKDPEVVNYIDFLRRQLRRNSIADGVERREFLTRIMRGEEEAPVVTRNGIEVSEPDHMSRIKAAMELAKMDGDYAPIKIDVKLGEYNREWLKSALMIISKHVPESVLRQIAQELPRYEP